MLRTEINSVTITDNVYHKLILSDIRFKIDPGKILTILGKNGSGKSTLIKSLTALLPENIYTVNGKVFFNDIDLLKIPKEDLREIRKKNIRYVFQDTANSLDPLKKIRYYFDLSNVSPLKIEELLNYFLLPSFKKLSHLHSYELSGGMNQRLLIVLSLLANPDILILDEPTSGIDYAAMNLILLKLKNFVRDNDKSVLIVTQDINFAIKISDQISFLSGGRLTDFHTPGELETTSDHALKEFINSFEEIRNVSA